MSGPINHDYAKGTDVKRVVEKIEQALVGGPCKKCDGTGKYNEDGSLEFTPCSVCEGKGNLEETETVVLMACLSLALIIQHPEIKPHELNNGVLGASEWVALYLSSLEDGDHNSNGIPPNKLN